MWTRDRGNILPLAIIMTTMVLLAGIGIGTVVLQGSQRAVETDQSVSAYYMADSGIERQLYEVRKKDATAASLATIPKTTYPNSGTWSYFGGFATTSTKSVSSIATSSFEVLDIFDPDNVSAAGVDHVMVAWNDGSDCGAQYAGMEVGFAEWTISGSSLTPSDSYTIVRSMAGSSLLTVPLDVAKAYRIRMRALTCTASNVTAQAYDALNVPKGFPGDVTLASEGTYGKATQKIGVTMPKTNVLSGIFSYVIFSECTLLKGTGTPTCP